MKTLNDYFTMNYRMEIVEDKDEGGFESTANSVHFPIYQGLPCSD